MMCYNASNWQFVIIFIILLSIVRSVGEKVAHSNDTSICKLSHLGLEYSGYVSKTESGVRCQAWQTNIPVHQVNKSITDDKFPENSRNLARNYCRNPNKDLKGPWCYTMDVNLIDETCGLPLCAFTECRESGTGIEYAGEKSHGMSGKKCLKWNKARSKVKFKDTYVKQEKFPKEKFTDENLSSAKKSCRNPDGDIGGPWCFVEIEDTNEVERDYCDVPFCDEEDCTLFTKNHSIYSHYARFNQTFSNLTFGIRLWDSDSFLKANARLILTILALPLTGKQIEDTGIGIEIFLSNTFTGLKYGNKDDLDFESSPGIIKSTEYTFFSVGWGNGFITLTKMGETKPLFLAEYKTKNNLLGHAKDSFYFYSAQGTDIIWSFPFCDDDDACEVHTTVTSSFQWFWLLRETNVGHDLHFYVRAFQWANILLVTTPAVGFPRIEIVLDGSDNQTRVVCTEFANGPKTILKEIPLKPLINYWKWSEFSFSLFAETLQIYLESDVGTHMIMEVKHALVKTMRWFSVSSHNNIAHWTFYCRPPQFANPPQAWLPNCALNQDELDYKGRQSVTHTGVPCLPWSAVNVLPKNIGELPLKTLLTHINYCRDLTHENKGTYCYVMQEDSPDKVEKHYCLLRKCKSVECRMAGTGNDYVGMLNVTRSNRTCHNWLTFVNNTNHSVNPDFLNNTLYADMSIQMAENYCRNPMRNVAGSWCYTTDLDIPDICNVRDCDMPEECIVIVRGNGEGRQTYILPQWKETGIHGGLHFALKEWNPDLADGIIFEIRPLTGDLSMKLMIGAENNEKMVLYYQSEIVKEKTLPHIIPAGKWVLFWLQIRKGEILLGYEGIPNSIFEWKHNTPDAFEPVFLSYRTMQGNAVGVFFKCDDCHSEITTSKHLSRIMPIGLWSETEHPVYTKLTLNVRGTGTLFISLMVLPATGNYYSIILGDLQTNIYFVKHNQKTVEVLKSGRFNESLFTNNSWTKFKIKFSEFSLNITRNSSLIFTHSTSNPMYFYWFSIGAENGPITWTANCDPPDIDGRPLDGGWSHWSPWQCTVSCGGGEGFRTRTCSNPRPNIFGKLCEGSPTSTGVCNDFECGDLSPETLNKIRDRLQTQQFSLVVSEGKPVLLENDRYLLDIITEESPESYYEWTLNGIFVVSDDTRIKFQYDNIFIKSVEISDMGVYVCMLRRINDERLVFRVISLAVTTDYYRISTRATLEFTLLSNAVVLAYVYSDLSQKWLLNNKVYLDYGISTLAAISSEHIKNISQSHSGEWRCIIQQEDLGLEWTTNVIKVNVNSAPNMYTHLMEDALTAPIFARLKTERNVFIAIIAIIVGVCSLVIIFVIVYFKFCTLPKTKAVSK